MKMTQYSVSWLIFHCPVPFFCRFHPPDCLPCRYPDLHTGLCQQDEHNALQYPNLEFWQYSSAIRCEKRSQTVMKVFCVIRNPRCGKLREVQWKDWVQKIKSAPNDWINSKRGKYSKQLDLKISVKVETVIQRTDFQAESEREWFRVNTFSKFLKIYCLLFCCSKRKLEILFWVYRVMEVWREICTIEQEKLI